MEHSESIQYILPVDEPFIDTQSKSKSPSPDVSNEKLGIKEVKQKPFKSKKNAKVSKSINSKANIESKQNSEGKLNMESKSNLESKTKLGDYKLADFPKIANHKEMMK